MGRRMLIAFAVFAMLAGGASQAYAQVAAPGLMKGWDARAGWTGSITDSAHQDYGFFGMTMPFHKMGDAEISAGFEVRIGYEFDYSAVQQYLGVVRWSNDKALKWPVFVDVYAGLEHFSGDSIFFLEPSVGAVTPWGFKDYRLFGQVGIPMHFYSGNMEAGFSGKVGLTLPWFNK